MKGMETKQAEQQLDILQNIDFLVNSTANFALLIDGAETNSIISNLEKSFILKQFGNVEDKVKAFYLLLNSKACPTPKVLSLLASTGNGNVASVLQERKNPSGSSDSEGTERDKWVLLQKTIADNIDRLSSHTMNLGLVLCFSSGIGLISAKDREVIANYSTLEIEQLKKFYITVNEKGVDAGERLIQVLKMTNNNWALDVLQIDGC